MAPRIFAISDLHIDHEKNRLTVEQFAREAGSRYEQDWLLLAGDVAESFQEIDFAWELLSRCFGHLVWVPGNHELWTRPGGSCELRGQDRYEALVNQAQSSGIHTPEDPFPRVEGTGSQKYLICPLFLLYDYSFRPSEVPMEEAVSWAAERNIRAADESFLFPDPFPSRSEWCARRCEFTHGKLTRAVAEFPGMPLILVNHYPLRYDLVDIPLIPRFSPWCGTDRTEEWHREFPVRTVVYGHLHRKSTKTRDGVRFEEVSLGYPRQRNVKKPLSASLRRILLP